MSTRSMLHTLLFAAVWVGGCAPSASPDSPARTESIAPRSNNAESPDSIDSVPPAYVLGSFVDDYGITYEISSKAWIQHPRSVYRVADWHPEEQYLVARNDSLNPSDAGLWTRIDWMRFEGMEPYEWGFCLTVYDARSLTAADSVHTADRENPRSGCGGFPFSRMRRP